MVEWTVFDARLDTGYKRKGMVWEKWLQDFLLFAEMIKE